MSKKTASEHGEAIDRDSFRALMRHQAGAVALISVGKKGNRTGLTATAVCSLTDSPPTVLVCVNKSASAHKPIIAECCFCVNLLSRDQQELALRFSGQKGLEGEDRFDDDDWMTLATGAPVLKGALANLDCELTDEHEFSTHSIFIGRVRAGEHRADAQPMLYFRGDFWDLTKG